MNNTEEKHNFISRAIIAGVMDWPAVLDEPFVSTLSKSDFYGSFGELWERVLELNRDGRLSTINLVGSFSPASGYDMGYFAKLKSDYPYVSSGEIIEYSQSLRNYSARRMLLDVSSKIAQSAHTDELPEIVVSKAIEVLSRWAMNGAQEEKSLVEVIREVEAEINERAKDPREVWGIPSGYPRLDKLTGGLQPGELLIIGGEPGIGKTWFVTQMAMQLAKLSPGAFLSLEMKTKPIIRRFLQLQGVARRSMMTGYMTVSDWAALESGMKTIPALPIHINQSALRMEQIYPLLARYRAKYKIRWFVLDYLSLLEAPGRDEIEKTQNISRELKRTCNELDLAGVVIQSVNKMGMDTDGATGKAKLRGSGQMIHDADLIFMLTKFKKVDGDSFTQSIMPARHEKIITLHIEKGRELERAGGLLFYERVDNTPAFKELDPGDK